MGSKSKDFKKNLNYYLSLRRRYSESKVNIVRKIVKDVRKYKDKSIKAIVGLMQDKDINDIIKEIKHIISEWYACSPNIDRAMSSNNLKELISDETNSKVEAFESVDLAIERAIKENDRILFENDKIRGSISLIGSSIDDLTFKQYRIELNGNEDSPIIIQSNNLDKNNTDHGGIYILNSEKSQRGFCNLLLTEKSQREMPLP